MRLRPTTCWSPIVRRRTSPTARFFSTTLPHSQPSRIPLKIPPPFPVAETCPEPTCSCPPTPAMPEGLPIDYDQPLNGTMAAYTQQVLVCTGQPDWTSRIENDGQDTNWGDLVRGLKHLMGRGGRYADPFNNVLVSNSSFPASPTSTASAFLFPSFKYFPSIPTHIAETTNTDTLDLSTFVRAFLLPEKLSAMAESLPEPRKVELTRKHDLTSAFPDAIDIQQSPVVLVCGHGGRDMRCGVMAPVLQKEFREVLQANGFASAGGDAAVIDGPGHAHIGSISHVGGHKYAGNVIVYIPPAMTLGESSTPHPLAGKGIWYGRIEPRHVEGVVKETILGGRVIEDHFRGGIDRSGDILRL